MALVPCRECGKEVSSAAPTCPYCGVRTPSKRRHQIRIASTVLIVIAVIAICVFVYHRVTKTVAVNFENAPETTAAGATTPHVAGVPRVKPDVPVKPQIVQKDYKEKIREMLDSGQTVREISKKTGIRMDEVRRIKKDKKDAEKSGQ